MLRSGSFAARAACPRQRHVTHVDGETQIGGQTFGWTVCWQNASSNCLSTTSWSGKLVMVNGIQAL